jgi:hypothetical protein
MTMTHFTQPTHAAARNAAQQRALAALAAKLGIDPLTRRPSWAPPPATPRKPNKSQASRFV